MTEHDDNSRIKLLENHQSDTSEFFYLILTYIHNF